MDKEYLKSIGAGDCPKHGRWYGICHSCAREQKEQDRVDTFRRVCEERDTLRAENQRLKDRGDILADVATNCTAYKGIPEEIHLSDLERLKQAAKAWREGTAK